MCFQHRPAAECYQEEQKKSPDNAKHDNVGDGVDDNDDDETGEEQDETVADQPPTISDNHNTAAAAAAAREDSGEGRHPTKNKQQQGSISSGNNTKGREGAAAGVASDAHLSCPLCFTTVCLECQRHAKYANQFRAVTGINVNVNHDEFLTLDQVSGGGAGAGKRRARNNRGKRASAATAAAARDSGSSTGREAQQEPPAGIGGGGGGKMEEEEMFHPVCCGECDHRVGVYDAEEIFHFFGVVASG